MSANSSSLPTREVTPKLFWTIFNYLMAVPFLYGLCVFFKSSSLAKKPMAHLAETPVLFLVLAVIACLFATTTYLALKVPVDPDEPLLSPIDFAGKVVSAMIIHTQVIYISGYILVEVSHNWQFYPAFGATQVIYNLLIIRPRALKYWREYERRESQSKQSTSIAI